MTSRSLGHMYSHINRWAISFSDRAIVQNSAIKTDKNLHSVESSMFQFDIWYEWIPLSNNDFYTKLTKWLKSELYRSSTIWITPNVQLYPTTVHWGEKKIIQLYDRVSIVWYVEEESVHSVASTLSIYNWQSPNLWMNPVLNNSEDTKRFTKYATKQR